MSCFVIEFLYWFLLDKFSPCFGEVPTLVDERRSDPEDKWMCQKDQEKVT